MAKIVEPTSLEKLIGNAVTELLPIIEVKGKKRTTFLPGKHPTEIKNEFKQSLRQLLLAGVPPERATTAIKESPTRFRIDYQAGPFNECRQIMVDYINKITE